MNKSLFLYIFVFLFLSNINLYSQFSEGDGSFDKPYLIKTDNDLKYLSFLVMNDISSDYSSTKNKYFKLCNNINMDYVTDFTPIGGWSSLTTNSSSRRFAGNFDGNCCIISNLKIYKPSEGAKNYNYVSLFGYTDEGSKICNLGLIDAEISGYSAVATLVGVNHGVIEKCFSVANITGQNYVSTFVGINRGEINNCYSKGMVNSLGTYIQTGGLVGINEGKIESSYTTTTFEKHSSNIGLLSGYLDKSASTSNSFCQKYSYLLSYGKNINAYPTQTLIDANPCTILESDRLKSIAVVNSLNSSQSDTIWRYDLCNLNGGYPILSWQIKSSSNSIKSAFAISINSLDATYSSTPYAIDLDDNDCIISPSMSKDTIVFNQLRPDANHKLVIEGVEYRFKTSKYPSFDIDNNDNLLITTDFDITEEISFDNIKIPISINSDGSVAAPNLRQQAAIKARNTISVEVDFEKYNDKWAYLSMPFDIDLRYGIRIVDLNNESSEERVVLTGDGANFDISLYDSQNRAISGLTQNWAAITSLPNQTLLGDEGYVLKRGTGFLAKLDHDKITSKKVRIYALNNVFNIGSSSVPAKYSLSDNLVNSGWTLIGGAFPNGYKPTVDSNIPTYLYSPNVNTNGYEVDIYGINNPIKPYVAYLCQLKSDVTELLFSSNHSENIMRSSDVDDQQNVILLKLYRGVDYVDKVGYIFDFSASSNFVIGEDAIKYSKEGDELVWNSANGIDYSFNKLPFIGTEMTLDLSAKINKDMSYKISKTDNNEYDVYIREYENGTWHYLNLSDYYISSSNSTYRNFSVKFVKSYTGYKFVSDDLSITTDNGVLQLIGVASNSRVKVFSVSGKCISDDIIKNDTYSTLLNSGIYILEIQNKNHKKMVKIAVN